MPLLSIEHVSKRYVIDGRTVDALTDVSLTIDEGVFLAIAGPSGSGKSTLLNMIGCIDTPDTGSIVIDGTDVSGRTPNQLSEYRARTVGFIFQTFNLFPVLSAWENVEYPLLQLPEVSAAERRERVGRYLRMVDLGRFGSHRPNQLSGGQRQRVAIARALATQPRIVLADEPTANLDHATGSEILRLMKAINQKYGTTFIFSTHDERVIAAADRLVRIEDGQVQGLGVRRGEKWLMVRPNGRDYGEGDGSAVGEAVAGEGSAPSDGIAQGGAAPDAQGIGAAPDAQGLGAAPPDVEAAAKAEAERALAAARRAAQGGAGGGSESRE